MTHTLAVRDPRTGRQELRVEVPSAMELAADLDRLRAEHGPWAQAGVEHRAAVLLRWAGALEDSREALVDALVADTGRLVESRIEVDAVIGSIRRWATAGPDLLAPEAPRTPAVPGFGLEQSWDPYELVGVISPWNLPLLLALIDAIPALVAGCAVVVKPSELTPRFIAPLRRSTSEVPELAAVLALVVGGPEVGRRIIDAVDAICFTGSVPTGRSVAIAAATRLIPAYLELGGKDPAIVTATADLELTSRALLWGATANAGQSCQSIERIYVVDAVHDALVDRLVARARSAPLALPTASDGVIGPIIAERQVEVIDKHLADAVEKGARVWTGGQIERHDGGCYLHPTVLSDVDHSMLVMTEETFAPILPVMRVGGVDEAVELANATEYGLSAAVFAGTIEEARAVAGRIRAGAVSLNDASLTAIIHDGEKQAYNHSGLGGSRMGPASLRRFLRRRAFLSKQTSSPDPWWHPEA